MQNYQKTILCVFTILCLVGITQSITCQTSAANKPKVAQSIRKVDFRNFDFPTPKDFQCEANNSVDDCFGSVIKIRKGFDVENKDNIQMSIGVKKRKSSAVLYSDLTEDGKEEAVVLADIALGDGSNPIFFVFTMQNGKPQLLEARLVNNFPITATSDRSYGEIDSGKLAKQTLTLKINYIYNDDNESKKSLVTKTYKWRGNRFVSIGLRNNI